MEPAHAPTIGEGGPLRLLEARCRLTRLPIQLVAALVVTWAPIALLGLAETAAGQDAPLLRDTGVHVRLLLATPILLFLDHVFPGACRQALDQLTRFGFVAPTERARYDRLLGRATRLAAWWLPEALLAAGALGLGVAALACVTTFGGRRVSLDPADWWYALVALPLFEFLLLRSAWRWVVWAGFLVGLARVRLDLDATHPDRRGGLSFLSKPSLAYCAILMFVVSAVLSAEWHARFRFVTLSSFLPLLLVSAAAATAVAFGPLLLFADQLYRARRDALLAIGGMAATAGRWLRQRWLDRPGDEAITSAEIQSLAAVAATYRDTVKAIRLLPFERRDLVLLLLATLLPVAPSMFLRIPRAEWSAMVSWLVAGGLR